MSMHWPPLYQPLLRMKKLRELLMDLTEYAFYTDEQLQEEILELQKLLFQIKKEAIPVKLNAKQTRLTIYRHALHLYYVLEKGADGLTAPHDRTAYHKMEFDTGVNLRGEKYLIVKNGVFWQSQAEFVTGTRSQYAGKNLYKEYNKLIKHKGPNYLNASTQSLNSKIKDQQFVLGTLDQNMRGFNLCSEHLEKMLEEQNRRRICEDSK